MKIRFLACAGSSVLALFFYLTTAHAVDYAGSNFEDPFFFGETEINNDKLKSVDFSGSMVLQGVLWDAQPPQAIISGQIVKAGMKIGDAEVVEISQSGVKMQANEKEFTLRMNSRGTE